MKKGKLLLAFYLGLLHISLAQNMHQQILATINVKESAISVSDKVEVPAGLFDDKNTAFLYLNKNLKITNVDGGSIVAVETEKEDAIFNKYKLTLKKSSKGSFAISYSGSIKDDIKESAAEYARGFSETKGTISEQGIYLAGSTYWLPKFDKDVLSSFDLDVAIDKEWLIVSQGVRTKNEIQDGERKITYQSPEPMDEVYLIGAKWTEYSKQLDKVEVQAFLRTPDEELANKYLDVTSGYLKMYEALIGPYPYAKFALVENFWETGYGMPSFTLLGEKIIRFPWILYSSYPHELLHNYWGNGVFVDYSQGNWCEGITAYMADHLLQEQQGNGSTYRRTTLQKFTDYVNEENDMPINKFLNRNNSAEEAIGYGKVLMVNNMLRKDLGDETFLKAYQKFYKDNKFSKASFSDIRKSFEEVSGQNMTSFFDQWINRKGAPSLAIEKVESSKNGNEFQLTFTLNQMQKEDVFDVKIPVAVYLENAEEVRWENVVMDKRTQNYSFTYAQKPLKVAVDPEFNIMRRLDRLEVPSSLSQVFGGVKTTLIVPSSGDHTTAYKALADTWKATQEAQGKNALVVMDSELDKIPTGESVWILGFENKFYENDLQTTYTSAFDDKTNELISNLIQNGSLVYAIPNPENAAQSVGFVGAASDEAIAALTRKLPHYGKYGYLGFEGNEATNVLKGSLPALGSPLEVTINEGMVKAKIVPGNALYPMN